MRAIISNPTTRDGVTSIVASFRGVSDVETANAKLHDVATDLGKTLQGNGLFSSLAVGIVSNNQVAVVAELNQGASIKDARDLLKKTFDPRVLL